MRIASRLLGALAVGAGLATCTAIPGGGERERQAPRPAPVVPVSTATPSPTPTPAPAPARFSFDGVFVQGGVVRGTAPDGTSFLTFDGESIPVGADNHFLIAFDRDSGPEVVLVARLADGREARETLTVAPRAWQIERLDSLPRVSQPSAEFQRRRPGEIRQIVAARATDTGADGWRQDFMWPVTGRISGMFGSQRIYRGEPGSYHSGVDVARPTGTTVVAPADGVVILAADSEFTLEGRLLMLDHGMGLNSAFLHLSRIDVRVGERVRRGQAIGAVGATGRATGPHLHWSMKWRDARIDPILLTGPMPAAQ